MKNRWSFFGIILALSIVTQAKAADRTNTDIAETQSRISSEDEHIFKLYPFVLFEGGMRGDLLFKSGNSFMVGPYAESVNFNAVIYKMNYWGAGLATTYHFGKSPMEHSWYLAPEAGIKKGQAEVDYGFITAQGDFTAYKAAVTSGYHWAWPSLNLWLGAGAQYDYVEVSNARGTFNFLGAQGEARGTNEKATASGVALTFDFALGIPF